MGTALITHFVIECILAIVITLYIVLYCFVGDRKYRWIDVYPLLIIMGLFIVNSCYISHLLNNH